MLNDQLSEDRQTGEISNHNSCFLEEFKILQAHIIDIS
jgi:hypothetical protein